MRLAGKTAIITGGGTGIGFACAELFAREGARVALFGRRKDRLEKACKQIGDNAFPIPGDVSRQEDINNLVNRTLEKWGQIDIVVNNAGVFSGAPLHEMTDQQWENILEVNLNSVFRLAREVLPHMLSRKSGNFIHISSILGLIATPQVAAYNTSKGGLNQLSRTLAVEYGPMGIRSNSICPGLIETEMTEDLRKNKELMEEWIKSYPIGRFGQPRDVANACLFLASDESSFITGAVLPVDGGYTAL